MGTLLEELSKPQQQAILKHLDLVIEANTRINLTRIDSIEEGMLLHIEDSLTALEEINASLAGRYGDLGSGAGYPGIPLAIATGRETLLIDARKKKMDAVAEMIEEIGISDTVKVFPGRAELLARREPSSFSVLTARALSQLSVLMELSNPLLKRGGRLICYKGSVSDEELSHAQELQGKLNMKLVSNRSFTLGNEYQRQIIVFEKTGQAKIALPRLEGQAQKNPL